VLTARLLIYGPHAEARVIVLRSRTAWTIGRDADVADIVIQDSGISKRHVRIERGKSPGSWMLTDLNSTNGTRVNGRRVPSTTPLSSNDVIRMGSTLAVLELAEWTEDHEHLPRSYIGNWLDQQIAELSQRWYPLLVTGESGTGKAEFCRAVAASQRVGRIERVPCSVVDADALRTTLSVFSAVGDAAASSRLLVIFEDIHRLALSLQPVLSQLLDGLHRDEAASSRVNVIATSSVALDELVVQGQFSRKLYGRVAGLAVSLPPLVERRMDILPAVARALGKPDHRALHPDVIETLLLYRWPGNFAELMTACANLRAAPSLAAQRSALPRVLRDFRQAMDESQRSLAPPVATPARSAPVKDAGNARDPSYEFLQAELVRANHNVSQMARNLKAHRNQVVRWLDRHGLRPVRR
jgi:transcriptional regulator of acetoin/glycerol metabolism